MGRGSDTSSRGSMMFNRRETVRNNPRRPASEYRKELREQLLSSDETRMATQAYRFMEHNSVEAWFDDAEGLNATKVSASSAQLLQGLIVDQILRTGSLPLLGTTKAVGDYLRSECQCFISDEILQKNTLQEIRTEALVWLVRNNRIVSYNEFVASASASITEAAISHHSVGLLGVLPSSNIGADYPVCVEIIKELTAMIAAGTPLDVTRAQIGPKVAALRRDP
jgi:hypothetical protein